jgi:Cu(I)-responsive transcriptional regulator
MTHPMNIGQAATAAGVTAKMIRHYEQLGLIPEAARTDSGYRQYTAREVAVLTFIRQSRSMGFSIRQIAQLLTLWADDQRQSREVKALAAQHIAELDRKMQEMAQMKAALERLATGCQGDQRADCPILDELSNHASANHAAAAVKAAPKAAAKAAARPRASASAAAPLAARADHDGLAAWMRSLHRAASMETRAEAA